MWRLLVSAAVLVTLVFAETLPQNLTCLELTRRCFTGETFSPEDDSWVKPLIEVSHPDGNLSQLLRYTPITKHAASTIPLDDTFMDFVALLHNNRAQLRTLLTLLKSDGAPTWMKIMQGYSECGDTGSIYTCVDNVCRAYDLRYLTYSNSIFTENVLGFDFGHKGQFAALVVVRHEDIKMHRPVRIPVATRADRNGLQLFYALYNLVRELLVRHDLDTALIDRLDKYYLDIPDEWKQPLTNNPALLHNGLKAVDVGKHS
ncbi:Rh147 [macacine betaherpesvirus 3]|uniref:Envelope glycoprotein L n=1 Tax=Rhesus cytomegalovirus (strain 68-1) TaxID=47929 RepID=F8SRF1_RHCM6|nr:glycoprotein L [macacine betaherpesvirus 3]QQL11511.1 Rh147 [macacine betaherpesvirus 3]